MAICELIFYPDPRLHAKAEPVAEFGPGLEDLARDLIDTLRAVPAIGLTAAHIGRLSRVTVIRPTLDSEPILYVNPQIIAASAERDFHIEGSVSMPGITERVERASRVTCRYWDLAGNERDVEAEGFLAACLQHEIDQLDGVFWINRLSRLRRERAIKHYAKKRSSSA